MVVNCLARLGCQRSVLGGKEREKEREKENEKTRERDSRRWEEKNEKKCLRVHKKLKFRKCPYKIKECKNTSLSDKVNSQN